MLNYLYELTTGKKSGVIHLPIRALVFALSLIYGLVVRFAMFICRIRQYQAGCKVISVGNITLGGTGKTPLVEYIARYLKTQEHRVAIVSRGYKKRFTGYGLRVTALAKGCQTTALWPAGYEMMGDEAYMLKEKLKDIPVIVDKNRKKAIERAIKEYNVDTVILDDGLQQWKIKKDLEIVAIDATCPFGRRLMLPAGTLRQPLSSLENVDIFVLTKTEAGLDTQSLKNFLEKINPLAIVAESTHSPLGFYALGNDKELLDLYQLKDKTAGVFCGIASPDSFENTVKKAGINIGLSFRFSDHHNYAQEDLERVFQAAKEKNIDTLITTEKDAVRLQPRPSGLRVMVLRIKINIIKNEERFLVRLSGMYRL